MVTQIFRLAEWKFHFILVHKISHQCQCLHEAEELLRAFLGPMWLVKKTNN